MPTYRATTEIAAAPQDVYRHLADPLAHAAWSADPIDVTHVAGDRYRSAVVSRGRRIEAELTLVEQEPPSRVVLDAVDATGRWRHTFTIERAGDGSRVTREITGDLSLAQLLLYWLVLLPIKRPSNQRSLERLRALVEGEHG